MKRLPSKRGAAIGLVLLLALFWVRPGAQRVKSQIVSSISNALGRKVSVSSASFRFLPRPGFDLQNFVVSDDPQFSAEPMLQAQEVTADLRWSSLLRGRLEISRLSLSAPSLNLVQNDRGHWNLENLLQRASEISLAPTSKARSEPRPGFPYIEASDGRVNFKFGQEKKPYALTDADFGLWQDSENSWGVRLEAAPIRTDNNLTDTGTVRISGTWQRASSLRTTPLQFSLEWTGGQLGEATELISGADMGWRGGLRVDATFGGTPGNLNIDSQLAVDSFRRYDLLAGENVGTQCHARYSSVDRSLSAISCHSQAGSGNITLAGDIEHFAAPRDYSLTLSARQVPMQSVVALLRSMKKDVPEDLGAQGMLDAKLDLDRNASFAGARWKGYGEIADLKIQSVSSDSTLSLKKVPFTITSSAKTSSGKSETGIQISPRLEVASLHVASSRSVPGNVSGWFASSGYDIRVRGGFEIQQLLHVARTLGIPALQPKAAGEADVDLQIAGAWAHFTTPRPVGAVKLRNVRAEIAGLSAPLQIASATLLLKPDETQVRQISASLAGAKWRGSLTLPRPCTSTAECPVQVDLSADQISSTELAKLFSASNSHRPWYRFLYASRTRASLLPSLRASGMVRVGRVLTRRIVGTDFSSQIHLEQGVLEMKAVHAKVLGGEHTGTWELNFSKAPFEISCKGKFGRVQLGKFAATMGDGWITGDATGTYDLNASGSSLAQIFSSAKADLEVTADDGWFPHIALADSGPLRIRKLAAKMALRNGAFTIANGKLETPEGIYAVSGTATMARNIDLKLTRDSGPGYSITGTLAEPRVLRSSPPATRAALKR